MVGVKIANIIDDERTRVRSTKRERRVQCQ